MVSNQTHYSTNLSLLIVKPIQTDRDLEGVRGNATLPIKGSNVCAQFVQLQCVSA